MKRTLLLVMILLLWGGTLKASLLYWSATVVLTRSHKAGDTIHCEAEQPGNLGLHLLKDKHIFECVEDTRR